MPMVKWAYGDSTDAQLFDGLCNVIRKRVPSFRIKYKNESAWQKFLGALTFFCKGYTTRYTTTLGTTIWFPNKDYTEKDKWLGFKILAHEYVHLLDSKKWPGIFQFLYVCPQIFTLLSLSALLAFWFGPWFLFGLCFLAFGAPWPALGRAALEMRGYAMNMAINIWRYGDLSQETRVWLVDVFTGWGYYKMLWNEETAKNWIKRYEQLIYNVDVIRDPESIFDHSEAYSDVYELLTGINFDDEEIE